MSHELIADIELEVLTFQFRITATVSPWQLPYDSFILHLEMNNGSIECHIEELSQWLMFQFCNTRCPIDI